MEPHTVVPDKSGEYKVSTRKESFLALPDDSIYFFRPISIQPEKTNIYPRQFAVDSLKGLKQ
jgi:hypothetical protein